MMRSPDLIQLDFLEQCQIGDQWKVREMLQSGRVDTHFHHKMNGWTGLHWAARRGHEAICLVLLEFGFRRDAKAQDGKTPFDVCPKDNVVVREILRPEHLETEDMPQASGSRRNSAESEENRFVPAYVKHPVFPYVGKPSSFDHGPASPTSPTKGGYYSYGRRDSVNRTRFLLLRTSCGDGKEAYKRITLPGGSSVDQLKKTIESAMKGGRIAAILTLPDQVLVEEDSQIAQFADCQKIDVIMDDRREESPKPKGDLSPNGTTVKSTMDSSDARDENVLNGGDVIENGDDSNNVSAEVEVEIQNDAGDGNTGEGEESEDEEQSVSVTLCMPTAAPAAPVTTVQEGEKVEEEAAAPISDVRKSVDLDSDPGDYVKVEREEQLPASEVNSLQSADMSIVNAPEEEKKEMEKPLMDVSPSSTKATVVEEERKSPKEEGGIINWMEQNPEKVLQAACVATVLGVAGLGCYLYARKLK